MTDIVTLPQIEPIDFQLLIRALQYYKRNTIQDKEHCIRLLNYLIRGKKIE